MVKTTHKYAKDEMPSDAEYWANQTLEECLKAVCFMVEQFISWNKLPSKMDKTCFEKTDKHREWAEEQQIWNSFSAKEKEMFYRLANEKPKDILDVKYFEKMKKNKK